LIFHVVSEVGNKLIYFSDELRLYGLSSVDDFSPHHYFLGSLKINNSGIQTDHQLDATTSPVYYPDVYLQLNMLRASSRPSSGAQQLQ
jgi:hypothetical protein